MDYHDRTNYRDHAGEAGWEQELRQYQDKFVTSAAASEMLRRKQETNANLLVYILFMAIALVLSVAVHYWAGIGVLIILVVLYAILKHLMDDDAEGYAQRKAFFSKYEQLMSSRGVNFRW